MPVGFLARNRKLVDPDRSGDEEELEEVGVGGNIINLLYEKN